MLTVLRIYVWSKNNYRSRSYERSWAVSIRRSRISVSGALTLTVSASRSLTLMWALMSVSAPALYLTNFNTFVLILIQKHESYYTILH